MMADSEKDKEFNRFEELARRLMKVPKADLDRVRKDSTQPPKSVPPRAQ